MRPLSETVSSLNGSPTLSIPASSSVGANSGVWSRATASSIAARRSGVSSCSPSGAANTRFKTPPCSEANSDSIRSVAFWVSEPGISNSSFRLPPTVMTRAIRRTRMPSQLPTTRQGCVAQARVQRASPPVESRSWARRRSAIGPPTSSPDREFPSVFSVRSAMVRPLFTWGLNSDAMSSQNSSVRWPPVPESPSSVTSRAGEIEQRLEQHRAELTAYCYRMLASPFEAEDAVQETLVRAWRSYEQFEGRAALRSWLYRIATNVCLDMLNGRERRARPMDLGPAREPVEGNLNELPEVTWIQPVPDAIVAPAVADPAEVAQSRETIRLAFVAALQHLPPRQRAVLILCEVLRWRSAEVAELLDTSVASVNSALQRARATLEESNLSATDTSPSVGGADEELLQRYVEAFERYDMDALTSLIRKDAVQSMPPYDLWLEGREDIFEWWLGPGIACRGSTAN